MLGGFGNGKIDATIASTTPLSVLRSVTPGFSGNSSKNFYLNELMYRNPYLFNEVKFKEAQFPFGLRNYRYNRGIVSTPEFLPESYYANEADKAITSQIGSYFKIAPRTFKINTNGSGRLIKIGNPKDIDKAIIDILHERQPLMLPPSQSRLMLPPGPSRI
ncbi:MAG: hypothetical protein SPJ27_06245 [Candidatus Onthovivens sp.]|nr:hypothetical protein [Candidatus Onthovivens sp.]